MFTIRRVVERAFPTDIDLDALFAEAAGDAYDALQDDFAALSDEPRVRQWPGDYPLEWTSERQKHAVMRKLRLQGRFPYRRDHTLATAWRWTPRIATGAIEVDVENPQDEASFVYGRGDEDNPLQDMQPFHRITGWEPATPKLQGLADKLAATTAANLDARLGTIF